MPHVQQYDKTMYRAGNQNWGLSVSPDGLIYAANTSGLLRFDGQQWKLHDNGNKAPLRSVNIAHDGKIFTGGLGEFGFWVDKGYGKLEYTSLTPLVEDVSSLKNDEIWRIIIDDQHVFFQSFSKAYIYVDNQITTLTADGEPFLFCHEVDGINYFEKLHSGLHVYERNTLMPVYGKDALLDKHILCMLPLADGNILIGTAKDGLYVLDSKGNIAPWDNEAQHLFRQYQINNGVKINDRLFAFGTIQNGVVIINEKGELIQHINKNNGLQNNTVLSLSVDNQSNLWVGLDNGIDRIDINSPFYYYSDLTGSIGTVYSSAIHQGKIYLGSNQGLFVSNWGDPYKHSTLRFQQVPHSHGQVWQLKVIDGLLYCGHNNGTYLVDGTQMNLISPITGGWMLMPLSNSPHLVQGNYTGLSLFDRERIPIHHLHQYAEILEPVKFMAEETSRSIWIGNNIDVKLINLSPDLEQIQDIVTDLQGLPIGRKYGIYRLGNRNVFATDSGFYRFDEAVRRFIRYDEFNEQLGFFANANKLQHIGDSKYWIFKRSHIAQIDLKNDGGIVMDSTTWNPLIGRMMNEYENILYINEDIDLIGLDNGFALYKRNIAANDSLPSPMITGFWDITDELSPIRDADKISYQRNNIRIAYSIPWYSPSPIRFQYRLGGYIDGWTDWDETTYKDFTNLPFGHYLFQVRAISATGTISGITELEFTVARPWYLSWGALIGYIILVCAGYILLRKEHRKRLAKQHDALRHKMQEEQKAALAAENERNERKLMTLKNEKLEQELAIKNRELANAAMNIVYKNEMLNNLHEELTKVKDTNGNKLNPDQLKKVNKLIDEAHSDDRDWNLFEESFNEAHENFFKKLKAEYPELVPNDMKLCAYLRLNMSSKEIASLLNISVRGVEIRRYRLRKKLSLPTSKNLSEFLLEL